MESQSTSIELQVRTVTSVNLADPASRVRARSVVEKLEEKSASAAKSRLLSRRITSLAEADSGSARVVADLQALAGVLRQMGLQPTKQRQSILGKLFGHGEKGSRNGAWDFYNARATIGAMLQSLTASAELLRQNDIALKGYEADILAEHERVTADIEVADAFERALVAELDAMRGSSTSPDVIRFIEQEVLLPLVRLRQNLQTLLAVNQQGAFSLSVLRENNATLIYNVQQITVATRHSLDTAALLHRIQIDQACAQAQAAATGRPSLNAAAENNPQQSAVPGSTLAAQDGSIDEEFVESINQLFLALGRHEVWYGKAIGETEKAIGALQDLSAKVSESADAGVLS